MALITRINRVPNSGFNDGNLTSWTPVGDATMTASYNLSWHARVTFPAGAAAGQAGISVPLVGLTPGVASRVWVSVPSASGSTTVKIQVGPPPVNLVPNPGFEVDTSGWEANPPATLARSTAQQYSGVASAIITGGGSNSVFTPLGTSGIPVTAGTTYASECWAYAPGAASLTFHCNWFTAAGASNGTTTAAAVTLDGRPWTKVSPADAVAPAGSAFASIFAIPNGTVYIDDVRFGVAGAQTSGTAFATNDPFFKQGAINYTPTDTTATLSIVNAVTSTAGDWVEIDYGLYDEGTTASYAYFDGATPGATWLGSTLTTASQFVNFDTDLASRPVAIVELDALPVRVTDFVLDRDSLDNPAVAITGSPRWVAVPEAQTVSISRGRDSEDQEIGPGTATIVLDDPDGVYDPDNFNSPLQVGKGLQAIRSGTGVRVSALVEYLGTLVPIPMFTGSLDDEVIERTWEPTVTISAVDDLSKLNTADIPPYSPPISGGSTTLFRALWALSFAKLTVWDATFGGALTRQMLATAGGGNVGSHLRDVAACEGGKLFVRADGRLHIGTHADDFAYTPAATFTDNPQSDTDVEYDDIKTSTSIGHIINRAIITRGGEGGEDGDGTSADAVTAQDDQSIDAHQRVWSETVDIPLYNTADALAMARWRASRRSRPATRVDSVTFAVHSQPLAWQVLSLDIADVVRARRQAWGRTLDGTYSVEGIDWSITAGGPWMGTVSTSPLQISALFDDQPQPFFLDTSLLDGPDVIAAY